MKKLLYIILLVPLMACQDITPDSTETTKSVPDISAASKETHHKSFKTDRDALAYALGADQGQGLLRRGKYLKSIGIDLSNEMTQQGFLDAFLDADQKEGDHKAVKLTVDEMKNRYTMAKKVGFS